VEGKGTKMNLSLSTTLYSLKIDVDSVFEGVQYATSKHEVEEYCLLGNNAA
jgi:hypothetical protein